MLTSSKGKDKGTSGTTANVKPSDQAPLPSDEEKAVPTTATNLADAAGADKESPEPASDMAATCSPPNDTDSAQDDSMAAEAIKREKIETMMVKAVEVEELCLRSQYGNQDGSK